LKAFRISKKSSSRVLKIIKEMVEKRLPPTLDQSSDHPPPHPTPFEGKLGFNFETC
jgi:hypothetical protein